MTFFPGAPTHPRTSRGPPTHPRTHTPLAFKHAAENHISNFNFKRKFTFISYISLFVGMDLVAPGGTFSCQGRGKVPGGVQQHVPKGYVIYTALWRNPRWAREFCNFSSQQNALQKNIFQKPKRWRSKWVSRWPKNQARQHEKCPTHLPTNN